MTKEIAHVTIAIPTYNSARFISETIVSALNQTIRVKKILIVDDNSSDSTLNICNLLKQRYSDNLIEVFEGKENCGYQKNWNRCFELCKTRYLLILHHDDILKEDTIEKQIGFLENNNTYALVGGQEDYINENGDFTHRREKSPIKLFKKGAIYEFIKETGSYIPCSTVLFDMKKIKEVGFFDEHYLASDELFWPEVLIKHPIAIFGEPLINRRIHTGQAEYSDFATKFEKIIESAVEQYRTAQYEENIIRQRKTLKILKIKTARNCIRISHTVFQMQKDYNTSSRYLKFAFSEYPKIFFSSFFIKFCINVLLGRLH